MAIEWECTICGYVYEGRQPPRRCRDCGANGSWEKVEYVIDWDLSDDDDDDDSDDEYDE
jgi:rubredoxin